MTSNVQFRFKKNEKIPKTKIQKTDFIWLLSYEHEEFNLLLRKQLL